MEVDARGVTPGTAAAERTIRYASLLLDAGESIKAPASYLGHADPGFTLRVYTHLMPASEERTRRAIDDLSKNPRPQIDSRPRTGRSGHQPAARLDGRLYRAATVADVTDAKPVVEVVAYDPAWSERFRVEQRLLSEALPTVLSVEHFGSTSIPGLAAKPIIDIMAVVPEADAVVTDLRSLERLGYVYRPMAFPEDHDHLFFAKDTAGVRSHHLHIFGVTSLVPAANRVLRAYIAATPDAARRYEAAKRRAAELHPYSRAQYGAAKEEMMTYLSAEARLWSQSARRPSEKGW
ncbi:GrpB family protein [Micromonospora sp. NBC_01392]|uniref:GrpB family protein n=1 Tax=Micromonospora sp. NBC_01392 TaxID=2903588 RepID=UPI003245740F